METQVKIENSVNTINTEMLEKFKLNFKVKKTPLYYFDEETKIETPYFAVVNCATKEALGTVTNTYKITQNTEIIELIQKGIKNFGNVTIKNGYSIDGGRKILIQLEVEGIEKINGRSDIKTYLNIVDSHDGTKNLTVGIGNLTLSCQNQFHIFYKNSVFHGRHIYSLEQKLKLLPEIIKNNLIYKNELIQKFNVFSKTEIKDNTILNNVIDNIVTQLTGVNKNMRDEEIIQEFSVRKLNIMYNLYSSISEELDDKGKNLWGLFSGITRWTTHHQSAPRRDNGKVESLVFGNNYKQNNKGLQIIESLYKDL